MLFFPHVCPHVVVFLPKMDAKSLKWSIYLFIFKLSFLVINFPLFFTETPKFQFCLFFLYEPSDSYFFNSHICLQTSSIFKKQFQLFCFSYQILKISSSCCGKRLLEITVCWSFRGCIRIIIIITFLENLLKTTILSFIGIISGVIYRPVKSVLKCT